MPGLPQTTLCLSLFTYRHLVRQSVLRFSEGVDVEGEEPPLHVLALVEVLPRLAVIHAHGLSERPAIAESVHVVTTSVEPGAIVVAHVGDARKRTSDTTFDDVLDGVKITTNHLTSFLHLLQPTIEVRLREVCYS